MQRLFFLEIFMLENGIPDLITDSLIIESCLPSGPFQLHSTFLHHLPGIGILGIMTGIDASDSDFFEEKGYDSEEGFRHDALSPPLPADTVADSSGFRIFIYLDSSNTADRFTRFLQFDCPLIIRRIGLALCPVCQYLSGDFYRCVCIPCQIPGDFQIGSPVSIHRLCIIHLERPKDQPVCFYSFCSFMVHYDIILSQSIQSYPVHLNGQRGFRRNAIRNPADIEMAVCFGFL